MRGGDRVVELVWRQGLIDQAGPQLLVACGSSCGFLQVNAAAAQGTAARARFAVLGEQLPQRWWDRRAVDLRRQPHIPHPGLAAGFLCRRGWGSSGVSRGLKPTIHLHVAYGGRPGCLQFK